MLVSLGDFPPCSAFQSHFEIGMRCSFLMACAVHKIRFAAGRQKEEEVRHLWEWRVHLNDLHACDYLLCPL
jgi:hypothetical protein